MKLEFLQEEIDEKEEIVSRISYHPENQITYIMTWFGYMEGSSLGETD